SAQGFDSTICRLTGIIQGMKLMPDDLPDDPVLLRQMLLEAQDAKEAYATHIVDLKEQIKLLRDRIFGR
ncbi:ISPsy5, transposase, partial [Pseudomonas syringae pv. actinidiae ICMP 19097]